jgi:uncharacterized protein involved in exopolysaccharide biosynthesis
MEALAPTGVRSPPRDLLFPLRKGGRIPLAGPGALRALLIGGVVGAILGGIVGAVVQRWYESSAQLAVSPSEDPTHPGNPFEGASAALPMLTALVQTGPAADEVIERLGLARVYRTGSVAQSRAAFWRHVTVTSDRRAGIVRITAEDGDPKRARDIALGLAEFGLRRMRELWAAGPRSQREKLEAQLAEVSENLAKAEQEMQRFRERTGFVESEERRGVLPSLGALPRVELEHARRKRAIAENAAVRDMLFRQIQQLRSAETRPLARIDLIDAPIESRLASRPSRLALVAVLGIGGAGLAWLLEQALARRRERRLAHMSVEQQAQA